MQTPTTTVNRVVGLGGPGLSLPNGHVFVLASSTFANGSTFGMSGWVWGGAQVPIAPEDLIAAIIHDQYSVGPSIRPICTRSCFKMTNMIQVCSNFHGSRVFDINNRRDEFFIAAPVNFGTRNKLSLYLRLAKLKMRVNLLFSGWKCYFQDEIKT